MEGKFFNANHFVYDGIVPVFELNSSGLVVSTHTFGASGLISRRSGNASVFYSFDSEGNVSQLVGFPAGS